MKKILIPLVVCFLLTMVCVPVLAKENLRFEATKVYWDGYHRLAVEGYFENSGTKTITGVTYFYMGVYCYIEDQYYLLTQGAWQNDPGLLSIVLKPGQRSSWVFHLNTEAQPSFFYWTVNWKLEYNFLI